MYKYLHCVLSYLSYHIIPYRAISYPFHKDIKVIDWYWIEVSILYYDELSISCFIHYWPSCLHICRCRRPSSRWFCRAATARNTIARLIDGNTISHPIHGTTIARPIHGTTIARPFDGIINMAVVWPATVRWTWKTAMSGLRSSLLKPQKLWIFLSTPTSPGRT